MPKFQITLTLEAKDLLDAWDSASRYGIPKDLSPDSYEDWEAYTSFALLSLGDGRVIQAAFGPEGPQDETDTRKADSKGRVAVGYPGVEYCRRTLENGVVTLSPTNVQNLAKMIQPNINVGPPEVKPPSRPARNVEKF